MFNNVKLARIFQSLGESKMFADAIHILFPTPNAMHDKFPAAPICWGAKLYSEHFNLSALTGTVKTNICIT